MQASQPIPETPDNKIQTVLIIALIVGILLCCCCIVLAGVGYYSYFTIRTAVSELPSLKKFDPAPTNVLDSTIPDPENGRGDPLQGGMGNDILKNDTWQNVAYTAVSEGWEQPIGADSTIELLQEPDAAGVWVEK